MAFVPSPTEPESLSSWGGDHSSYSDDGLTWKFIDFFGFSGGIASRIAYGGGKFVAVDSGRRVASSVDGVTWTAEKFDLFGGSRRIGDIAYGAGRFVMLDYTDDATGKALFKQAE